VERFRFICSVSPCFISSSSDAYDTAKMLCEKYYLAAPELKIEEFNSKSFVAVNSSKTSFSV